MLAKWLAMKPDLLIVDEPTRGIDVGAKAEVHDLIRTFVREGGTALVISSDLPEVLALGDRILVMPLYPQYSASATATVFDATFEVLKKMRNPPALRTVKHFHDDPAYIQALKSNVQRYWSENGRPDLLVISFHGIPRFALDRGDPYHCECHKTGRLLAEALGLPPEKYRVTFQSRFGQAEWLKPYTSETLEELGRAGTRRIDDLPRPFGVHAMEVGAVVPVARESNEVDDRVAADHCRGQCRRVVDAADPRHQARLVRAESLP
jgi:ferrochelatase